MSSATSSGRATGRMVRHRRLRARLQGTLQRPRLSVFRSARHLVVQLVDDTDAKTLIGLTDQHVTKPEKPRGRKAPWGPGPSTGPRASAGGKAPQDTTPGIARAWALGNLVAERAKRKGISRIVFDRGGYAYHGQVRAVAEGARAGGLQF